MKRALTFAALPALGLALPGYKDLNLIKERQNLGGLGQLGNVVNDLKGTLGSVSGALDLDNKRPEPGFEYVEPLETDSRGPCPGLNLLANYGYLPHDGHVNVGQVLEAVSRGFNMGMYKLLTRPRLSPY